MTHPVTFLMYKERLVKVLSRLCICPFVLQTLLGNLLYCRWFQGFNWEALRHKRIQAPIIPPVSKHFTQSKYLQYLSWKLFVCRQCTY